MALTTQEGNFINELMIQSQSLLNKRDEIRQLLARYNNNDFGSTIPDSDFQENNAYKHLTQSIMWNCITAMTAFVDSLGDDVTGQAVNLHKMKG